MTISDEEKNTLEEEFNEAIEKIDKWYRREVSASCAMLWIIVPLIMLVVVLMIFDRYYIALLFLSVIFLLSVFLFARLLSARNSWKKEHDRAIYVFNVKLLQISLQKYVDTLISESADTEIDSTKNSHK